MVPCRLSARGVLDLQPTRSKATAGPGRSPGRWSSRRRRHSTDPRGRCRHARGDPQRGARARALADETVAPSPTSPTSRLARRRTRGAGHRSRPGHHDRQPDLADHQHTGLDEESAYLRALPKANAGCQTGEKARSTSLRTARTRHRHRPPTSSSCQTTARSRRSAIINIRSRPAHQAAVRGAYAGSTGRHPVPAPGRDIDAHECDGMRVEACEARESGFCASYNI